MRYSAGLLIFIMSFMVLLCAAPPSPDLEEALRAVRAGNCDKASDVLSKSFVNREKAEPAYQLLSTCYVKTGKISEAISLLRQALSAFPDSPLIKRTLGELLLRKNPETPEAGELLRRALEMLPLDPEAHHFYAQWAFLNNQPGVCIAQEAQTLSLIRSNPVADLQAHALRALCEDKLEEAGPAQRDFYQANQIDLMLDPFDPETAFQYADFLNLHAEEAGAQTVIDEILKRAPQFGPAHLSRAKFLYKQQKPEEAIREIQLTLAGQGNSEEQIRAAHVLLARLYFTAGRTEEAEKEQNWVIEHTKR